MSDREKLIELFESAGEMLTVDEAVATELSGCENGWIKDKIGFIVDYFISNGVTVQKWIPVSEPPKEYRDKYGELIPFLVCGKDTEYPYRALYDGKTWGDGLISIYPTHWMPLPEPPKGCE